MDAKGRASATGLVDFVAYQFVARALMVTEIYSQLLSDFNRPDTIPPIPQYIETWEGRRDPKSQEYPLQLLTGAPKRQTHATLHNLPWLRPGIC